MALFTKIVNGGIGVGNFNVAYWLPDNPSSSNLPVFLFIPGSGESGSDVSRLYVNGPLKFIQSGSWKPPFVVIGAQTPYSWGPNWQSDPIFMRAVLKEVTSGFYPIDPSKVVLTGLSYGAGHIMNYMQFEKEAQFVYPLAAIPMSIACYGEGGSSPNDYLAANDSRFSKIPMWGFCGTSDSFYSSMGHFFSLLNIAKYPSGFTSYSGGHGGWNTFYDPNYKNSVGQNIYDWALAFSVPLTTTTSTTTTSSSTTTTTTKEFIVSVQITYSSGRVEVQP